MKNILKQAACIMLALTIFAACAPPGLVWAVDGAPGEETAEGAENASSVIVDGEAVNDAAGNEDAGSGDESTIIDEDEENDTVMEAAPSELISSPAEDSGETAEEGVLTVDSGIEHGIVTMDGLQGTAIPDEGYDLATVRQIWTDEEGIQHEQYLDYTENSGSYLFEAEENTESSEITAFFFSLTKWDGAVDLTWYDPDQTEFEIGTPAQLAGLAAIANGMVDGFVTDDGKVTTAEYMIKDNEGRSLVDGVFKHEYLSTEPWLVDLLSPNSNSGTSPEASQVRDTAWRLPEVEHNKLAADDVHNDFLYRTVRLTADLDMSGANWTPIGGKYAMNRDAKTGSEATVIDTRFQGIFDGQGHTVKLDCNRQAKMGFPYAMEIALIGYLGGGVDYENGYPKDTCMDYKKYWVPTVRNVVVTGEVKGRRMVGGVVGRIGETNYGVVVENCANFADIEGTDMRGCAGIVGAAWGKSVIRNCYNAGTIHSGFWEHGGIVGSNGYEGTGNRVPCGANIYNCYNVGDSGLNVGNGQYDYDGKEIGVDGNAGAAYEIANCYYIEPQETIEGKTGYCAGESSINKKVKARNVEALDQAEMKTRDFVDLLNMNGKVFVSDEGGINNGYPVLFYQTDGQHSGSASITLDKAGTENGSISFLNSSGDSMTGIPYGGIVDLPVSPDEGHRFSKYIVTEDNGSGVFEAVSGSFVAVTGKDITVRAVFDEVIPTAIIFNEPDDTGVLYYVEVKNVGHIVVTQDGEEKYVRYDTPTEVRSGDQLGYRECISITGVMKDWGEREPDDNNTEYTGKLSDPYEDPSLKKVSGTNNVYEITGANDTANIQFKPKTQGKRWSTIADTSWYTGTASEYVITTAKQLAGVSRLCLDGITDFAGVTIKLGNDISLANTRENGGNGYEMSWFGIGVARTPFRGTFDGQGHTISHMHRNFASGICEISGGARGGLFGVTEGAVIKNVNVESGTYNDGANEYNCGFINGATGGGIAGIAEDTLIENCRTNIPMNGGISGIVGGIAGEIEGNTIIRNCTSNCTINCTGESAGGIAAIVSGNDPRIENCINNGEITSTKWKVGGILGSGESYSATISQCVNNGKISTSMKGTSSAVHSMGGIAGYSAGSLTISQCVNKGSLNGYQQTYAMGGIAGTILRGTITDSINLGDIYSESGSGWAEVSGISNLGTMNSTRSTVKNSYNAGRITLGEDFPDSAKKNVGGVTGYGSDVNNVYNNAFCTDSSVAECGGKAGKGGSVVSEAQLRSDPSSLLGDNFVPDINNVNGGFPVLAWQDPEAAAAAKKDEPAPAVTPPAPPVEYIDLPTVKISKPKAGKKKMTVKWKKVSKKNQKKISGIQIQVATDPGFTNIVQTATAGKKKTSKAVKGLQPKTKYYVRIRAYAPGSHYSVWKLKSVKIK